MKNGIKGLVMLSLAYFLFSRITNGTLFYYINNRFAWLTLLAVIGFVVVGLGFLYRARLVRDMLANPEEYDDHQDEPGQEHDHDHSAHDHSHALSRVGVALILLPVVLGLLVPARPLGATAMGNREVSIGRLSSAAAPRDSQIASSSREKNLLDWLLTFDRNADPAAFDGQQARLVGFVYRDSSHGDDTFMLSRFVVSCCVADATPIGVIVHWPEASALAVDQWVEVAGKFQAGAFDGRSMPVLMAEEIKPTATPNQPYLFP